MRRAACLVMAIAMCACGSGESAEHRALVASNAARRLVGSWDLSFDADSTSTALRLHPARGPVAGTIAFTLNRSGPSSSPDLRDITHEGAYDLDFAPFGFSPRGPGALSVAIARVQRLASADSLWIVLSPGSDRFPVRMHGALGGDSAAGVWTAEAFSSGGGTGHFVMHRHVEPR